MLQTAQLPSFSDKAMRCITYIKNKSNTDREYLIALHDSKDKPLVKSKKIPGFENFFQAEYIEAHVSNIDGWLMQGTAREAQVCSRLTVVLETKNEVSQILARPDVRRTVHVAMPKAATARGLGISHTDIYKDILYLQHVVIDVYTIIEMSFTSVRQDTTDHDITTGKKLGVRSASFGDIDAKMQK